MPAIKAGTRQDGNVKGADHGASISLILDESDPGEGPRLHRHPYDETWIVQEENKLVCIHASPTFIGEWLE